MFEPGQSVVVRGKCLGKVISAGSSIVVEELDLKPGEESQFEIPRDRATEALRPIVDRAGAERVLAIVRERIARPPADERALAYRRAIKSGDLEEQARLLAAAYRGPTESPENQYLERLEKSVFGELALVLGKSRKTLVARTRSAVLGEAPPRGLSLPDVSREVAAAVVPALKGLTTIGAFAVHDRIACGESRAEASVLAVPGIWFAYALDNREDDDVDELIAIHRDHVTEHAALKRAARLVGKSPIEGAHIAIFDEALADDRDIFEALGQTSHEILENRCATVGLGGDGLGRMYAAPTGRAAYVRVDLRG
jgi:RNA polymerase-interacting CarD/CdnL/TRCF family regulator